MALEEEAVQEAIKRLTTDNMGPLSLALGLAHLRDRQKSVLIRFGEHEVSKEVLCRYGNALFIEVGEFVNETNWKSWKDFRPDPERLADEFADILHFIGTWTALLELMGVSATELALQFERKYQRNEARRNGAEPGYLGDLASRGGPTAEQIAGVARYINSAGRPQEDYPAMPTVPVVTEPNGQQHVYRRGVDGHTPVLVPIPDSAPGHVGGYSFNQDEPDEFDDDDDDAPGVLDFNRVARDQETKGLVARSEGEPI